MSLGLLVLISRQRKMKKIISILVFFLLANTTFSQVDYSILLQNKISKTDLKNFNGLHKKIKKVDKIECLFGDCKTKKSIKKITLLVKKINDGAYVRFKYRYIYILGDFKNSELNGEAGIFSYQPVSLFLLSDFYENAISQDQLERELKKGNFNILNEKTAGITEYIEANFNNNLAVDGCYYLIETLEKNINRSDGILLSSIRYLSELPMYSYLKNYNINRFTSALKDRHRLLFYYKGVFKPYSYSILSFVENGYKENLFTSIELHFNASKNDNIRYVIKPTEEAKKYVLDVFINNNIKADLSKSISLKGTECKGCDITYEIPYTAALNDKITGVQHQNHQESVLKLQKALGEFITYNYKHYYVNELDGNGCANVVTFPLLVPATYDYNNLHTKNLANSLISYNGNPYTKWNLCNPKKYTINKNMAVCSVCNGTGELSSEIVYKIKKVYEDDNGNEVSSYTTYNNTGKFTNVTCHVCNGLGVESK